MAAYLGYTLRMRTLFRDQLWLMTRIREEEEGGEDHHHSYHKVSKFGH